MTRQEQNGALEFPPKLVSPFNVRSAPELCGSSLQLAHCRVNTLLFYSTCQISQSLYSLEEEPGLMNT